MAIFIGNSEKAELGAPREKTKSTLRQSIAFLRLCPRTVSYFFFSFCEIFTREARNDLAEPVEIDAFEGGWIRTFSGKLPHASQHRINVPKYRFL